MTSGTIVRVLLAVMLVATAGGAATAAPASVGTVESLADGPAAVDVDVLNHEDDPWWCHDHKTYEPCPHYP